MKGALKELGRENEIKRQKMTKNNNSLTVVIPLDSDPAGDDKDSPIGEA